MSSAKTPEMADDVVLRPEQLGNWRAACSSKLKGTTNGMAGVDQVTPVRMTEACVACQRRGGGEVAGGSA